MIQETIYQFGYTLHWIANEFVEQDFDSSDVMECPLIDSEAEAQALLEYLEKLNIIEDAKNGYFHFKQGVN